MNVEPLKHHLATKVMGYRLVKDNEPYPFTTDDIYENADGNIFVKDFDPLNNISQAMGCLDTFVAWQLSHDDLTGSVEARVWNNIYPDVEALDCDGYAEEDTVPMAISLACAFATNWEDSE